MRLLSRHELALAKLAGDDSACPGGEVLNVLPDRVEVTNGYYAIRVWEHTTPEGTDYPSPKDGSLEDKITMPDEGFLLFADAALAAVKSLPKNPHIPVLGFAAVGVNAQDGVTLATTDLETWNVRDIRKVGVKFPSLDKVQPSGEVKAEVCLSAKYLRDLAAFVMGMDISRVPVIRLRMFDTNGQHAVELAAGNAERHFGAVLIPMRGDSNFRLPTEPNP